MKFWKVIITLIGIMRVLLVFLIFSRPYLAVVLSLFFDAFDSWIAYKAGFSWREYTRYDKLLDYWWYIFILIFSRSEPIFGVMVILFVIRSIGQLITVVTGNDHYLFWFPNIFENYFLVYLIIKMFAPEFLTFFTGTGILIPLAISFVFKMPQEYVLHRNRNGWFYSKNAWPRSIKELIRK